MNTQLPQILQHNILPLIPLAEVQLRVGGAVSAPVDALGPTLLGLNEIPRAVPRYVVWGELSVASFLENLGVAFEALDEVHLLITSGAALVVAVGPELVLDPLVRVRHRLGPVYLEHDLVASLEGLLERVGQGSVDECGGDPDLLHVGIGFGAAVLGRIHGNERLVYGVRHQNRRCSRLLPVPYLEGEVAF